VKKQSLRVRGARTASAGHAGRLLQRAGALRLALLAFKDIIGLPTSVGRGAFREVLAVICRNKQVLRLGQLRRLSKAGVRHLRLPCACTAYKVLSRCAVSLHGHC